LARYLIADVAAVTGIDSGGHVGTLDVGYGSRRRQKAIHAD